MKPYMTPKEREEIVLKNGLDLLSFVPGPGHKPASLTVKFWRIAVYAGPPFETFVKKYFMIYKYSFKYNIFK